MGTLLLRACVKKILIGTLLSLVGSSTALAQIPPRNIHFWIKAFIGNPVGSPSADFTKSTAGKWLLKAPLASIPVVGSLLPQGCFTIDDRGFSDNPLASARVTFEANLIASARDLRVMAYPGRNMVRIGEGRNVNCATGADLQPSKTAAQSTVSVGSVVASQRGRLLVFNVRASSPNPYYQLGILSAPQIDFELVFTFDVVSQKITLKGVTGTFPSFEAYYAINSGPVVKILNRSPATGAGPGSLADFGTGLNTANFTQEIKLPLR